MKVVIQRCKHGEVLVDNKLINKVDKGYVILVGVNVNDTIDDALYLVRKTLNLRVFDDENGVMNKSILDVKGEILSISQFTLQATTKDGNRPSYINAMNGEEAVKLYNIFNDKLNEQIKTYPGVFGADMLVKIDNDGPITIIIDSKDK
jgi:D-aminoacyl-tRNA deacylase